MSQLNDYSEFNSLIFPSECELGALEIVEVYQFYDIPLCFLSTNQIGELFLSTLNSHNPLQWLLLPISKERFLQIKTGVIDLHDAFILSELEILYYTSAEEIILERITEVDQDIFPRPGSRLEIRTHTNDSVIQDIVTHSKRSHREVLDIAFDNQRFKQTVFPAMLLSQELRAIQECISALPIDIGKKKAARGKLSSELLQVTELGITELFAASFGVRMIGLHALKPLFGKSVVEESIEKFLGLLELPIEKESARIALDKISPRAINKFVNILKLAAYSKTTIKTNFSAFGKMEKSVRLTYDRAETLANILTEIINDEPLEYEIQGFLIGLVLNRKTFVIEVEGDVRTKIISGQVLDAHLHDASYATINAAYKFRLRELESYNVLTGESKIDYFLLSIGK